MNTFLCCFIFNENKLTEFSCSDANIDDFPKMFSNFLLSVLSFACRMCVWGEKTSRNCWWKTNGRQELLDFYHNHYHHQPKQHQFAVYSMDERRQTNIRTPAKLSTRNQFFMRIIISSSAAKFCEQFIIWSTNQTVLVKSGVTMKQIQSERERGVEFKRK